MVASRPHATNEQRLKILNNMTGPTVSGTFAKTTHQHRSTLYRWKRRHTGIEEAAGEQKKSKSIVAVKRGPVYKHQDLEETYVI